MAFKAAYCTSMETCHKQSTTVIQGFTRVHLVATHASHKSHSQNSHVSRTTPIGISTPHSSHSQPSSSSSSFSSARQLLSSWRCRSSASRPPKRRQHLRQGIEPVRSKLGDGTTTDQHSPTLIAGYGQDTDLKLPDGGGYSQFMILVMFAPGGSAMGSGGNYQGYLATEVSTASLLPGLGDHIVDVARGAYHTLVIRGA